MKTLGRLFRSSYNSFNDWRYYANSRKEAHRVRKNYVEKKGSSVLNRKLLNQIKEYSGDTFGSPAYWPWLACYTEIREDFKEGWVPNDYYKFELIEKLNPRPISMISTIKSFDHRLFNGFMIDPIAVKISGCFYDHKQKRLKKQHLLDLLKSVDREMIVKIDGGPSGKGHLFITSGEVDVTVFEDITDCVIQPVVKQHKNLNELYDKSVNTLRIVTLLNDDTVDHACTFLRFGSGGNRLDNICAGGSLIFINLNGNVTSSAYNGSGWPVGRNHPNTGFEYKTLKVPSVSEAVSRCKEAHDQFPYAKLVAWDVFINEQGEPRLLEWNTRAPNMWLEEALIGPLFMNHV
ncbi:MAG TPA: sugar-transfer associated ATP-grasp domain-containing protein [Chitinophagaceae bacterium]|nr:sugar-transfer associated ATP-grasp domain-containing protein [Chitinophagaceae bacterium]